MYVRMYGRTDKGDAICPPIINGGGIKKTTYATNLLVKSSNQPLVFLPILPIWKAVATRSFALPNRQAYQAYQ